jgi:hypothetical protein
MILQDLRVETTPGGTCVFFRGKNLYHEMAPKEGAEAKARQVPIEENCLLIVPSPLAGYGLEELLRRIPESSHILCIEVQEELMGLSISLIPEDVLKNPSISFIRTDSISAAVGFTDKILKKHRIKKTKTVLLNRGYRINPELYRRMDEAFLLAVQNFWRNKMTALHMGRLWIKNFLINLSILPSMRRLSEFTLTKPTVVAGAGESVEGSLRFLKDNRDSIQIVAVDTVLPVLQSAGIRPDLIVVAEAQYANFYDFIGLQDWSIPVAADLTSYHGILRRFTGPRYVFLSRFEDLSWFEEEDVMGILPPVIPPLGSVGVMALYIVSHALDRNVPIFLTGFDFSYSPGKPHSRGAPSHILHLLGQGRCAYPVFLEAWFNRPKKKLKNKHNRDIIADGIIASYADGMRALVEERGNVHDLGGNGLFIGATVTKEPVLILKEFRELKTQHSLEDNEKWDPAEIEKFYMRCLEDLDALDACDTSSDKERGRFRALIQKNDYLTIDFPDAHPLPHTDDFVRRCLGRVRWYREKIRQGRENLSRRRS